MTHLQSGIADIERRSQQIGEITAVIDAISMQTNLLALNAAIEAGMAQRLSEALASMENADLCK